MGGLGKVAKKNKLKTDVMCTLNSLLGFVNILAMDDAVNSEEIITGANLLVCKKRSKGKQNLSAKQGLSPDEIILYCIAEKINGMYVDATDEATVVVTGMERISTLFRKCSKTKKGGKTKWCTPVEIVPN